MRRKMKLIREILTYVEEQPAGGMIPIPEFDDYSQGDVSEHVKLCAEAGFLEITSHRGYPTRILRMTWQGHEELKRLREA